MKTSPHLSKFLKCTSSHTPQLTKLFPESTVSLLLGKAKQKCLWQTLAICSAHEQKGIVSFFSQEIFSSLSVLPLLGKTTNMEKHKKLKMYYLQSFQRSLVYLKTFASCQWLLYLTRNAQELKRKRAHWMFLLYNLELQDMQCSVTFSSEVIFSFQKRLSLLVMRHNFYNQFLMPLVKSVNVCSMWHCRAIYFRHPVLILPTIITKSK